jgi:carbonic anhydrase
MRSLSLSLALCTFGLAAQDRPAAQPLPAAIPATPEAALEELLAGNARFVAGRRIRTIDTRQDPALRGTLVKGQSPFAVIVTCSDSRVPDSLVFDQEAGRLFTVREAGNAPDLQGIASVEYAVEHLGSRLVLVLGHTGCGAVKAVREARGMTLPGTLWALQGGMAGLLESTPETPGETPAAYGARLEAANARRQAQALLDRSPLLRERAGAGRIRILPALYHLDSGRVELLKPATPLAEAAHP